MPVDITTTIGEIVWESPGAAQVFESFGINHWSSGHRSLEDICASSNLSILVLQERLADALGQPHRIAESRWLTCALGDLIDYIVEKHHAYAKLELLRLRALAEKVCARHHLSHPELYRISESIGLLGDKLLPHMLSEEQGLFTRLKAMELAVSEGKLVSTASFGSILPLIRSLMAEHDDAGQVVRKLRMHAKGYVIPGAVCVSFEALYHGLSGLESDLRQHIHFEDDILFPRVLELERVHETNPAE
jgi:regulator of cell morphogenesis and NO signaling